LSLELRGVVTTYFAHSVSAPYCVTVRADVHLIQCPKIGVHFCREDTLQLSGWTRARRVVVLRRRLKGDVVLSPKDDPQGTLAFIESSVATAGYEYAVPPGTQGDLSHRPIIRFSRSPNSTAIARMPRTISMS
ncbi:MAG: hypothetical protein ACYDEV_05400, partial [Acidiferrobacter sp.]